MGSKPTELDESPQSRITATWRECAGFAVAYCIASELGYLLSLGPTVGGTFWPPSGVALAVFLLASTRRWPALIASAIVANFVSDQVHGQNLPASFGFALANIVEPVLGAWILRRLFRERFTFSTLSQLVAAAAVVIFISAPLAALIGGLSAELWTVQPPGFGTSWSTWWVGDAVGAIVLAPAVTRGIATWRDVTRVAARRWLEVAALAGVIVLVTHAIFEAPTHALAMPFLVFPVMIWASVRLGVVAVGCSLCLVILLATPDTADGRGPFAAEQLSLGERLIALQTYVGVMALSFYVLAILWEERDRIASALRQAHSGLALRYHRLVEQSPLAILTAEPDGTVKETNPAWHQFWGPRALEPGLQRLWDDPRFDELELRPLLDRAFAGEVVELPGVWVRAWKSAELGSETKAQDATLSAKPSLLRGFAYPVKNEADVVDEVVIIERDVTQEFEAQRQLREANEALRERQQALSDALALMQQAQEHREQLLRAERHARREAQRASELKDEFLAMLSHELRTPLNAIVGWTHVLRCKSPDAATLDRATEAIERNARMQTKLIEDLLDMSRIMAGKMALMLGEVALDKVVTSAVEALRHDADAKHLALNVHLEQARACWVKGDAARLQQVVTNLIGNSIKFTPQGGSVEVRLEWRDGMAWISVRDSGQGIAPDFLPEVFQKFRQGDGSITRRHGGLGLGLSITQQIVELHGGSIAAHSEGLGLGATFTVTLPGSVERADTAIVVSTEGPSIELAGLRILAVDDQPDARELLSRLLAQHGCEVSVAASAPEALDILSRCEPDILLSDIAMADTDGYELLRLVRAASNGRAPRAIAVTAFARPEDRERALAAGFDAHVTKPVDPEALLRVLQQLGLGLVPRPPDPASPPS